VNRIVWQRCGWAEGQGHQPRGKPPGLLSPGARSARPWGWGQTRAPSASPPERLVGPALGTGQTKSTRGA